MDRRLPAFHCVWRGPSSHPASTSRERAGTPYDPFDALHLLTAALSARKWRQWHGPIGLYADPASALRYEQLGMLDLWDPVRTEPLASLPETGLDLRAFWSAGKLLAYHHARAPVAFLDLDLVLWNSVRSFCHGDLAFTHWEATSPSRWYPARRDLQRWIDYPLPDDWAWQRNRACNAAFLYFGSEALKESYTAEAFRFMHAYHPRQRRACGSPTLFVEQRLLALMALHPGWQVTPLLDAVWSPTRGRFTQHDPEHGPWQPSDLESQLLATHVWLTKEHLRRSPSRYGAYCRALARRLLWEFPDTHRKLSRIEVLRPWLPPGR